MADVLVVDDSPFIRTMVAGLCEAEGWDVATASTVGEARQAIRREIPQVLVLDYHLPDGYGTDLVEQARGIEPEPLIIALSMQPRSHVKGRFGRQDVHMVLDKEVILRSELIEVLRERIASPPEA